MARILVLGAGHVARPAIRYLLEAGDIELTVADMTIDHVEHLLDGHSRGRAVQHQLGDDAKSDRLIEDHDVVLSLLPNVLHPLAAKLCVRHGRHLVTTSYVSDEMAAFDTAARENRVLLLNEIGADPGVDHMLAMRIIHAVRRHDGRVVGFRSYCGGLPAPDSNTNPWGYKFSWSPKGVCLAGTRAARWRDDEDIIDVPGPELFLHGGSLEIDEIGELEDYPNRDSLKYESLYGLEFVEDMYRATLRYPGWRRTMKAVVDLGLLSESTLNLAAGASMADFTRQVLESQVGRDAEQVVKADATADAGNPADHDNGAATDFSLRAAVASHLKMSPDDEVIGRLQWLGLFDRLTPAPLAGRKATGPLDVLAAQMDARMPYGPGERDMLVMMHEFIARYPSGAREKITCTMIDYGRPDGDSAMSRLVGLPSAIAARFIAKRRIEAFGVQIPVLPEIYEPVLDELASLEIVAAEETTELDPARPFVKKR